MTTYSYIKKRTPGLRPKGPDGLGAEGQEKKQGPDRLSKL
jgi:hypothetical protein